MQNQSGDTSQVKPGNNHVKVRGTIAETSRGMGTIKKTMRKQFWKQCENQVNSFSDSLHMLSWGWKPCKNKVNTRILGACQGAQKLQAIKYPLGALQGAQNLCTKNLYMDFSHPKLRAWLSK